MKRLLTVVVVFAWIDLAAQSEINSDEYSLTWNKGSVVFATGDSKGRRAPPATLRDLIAAKLSKLQSKHY